MSPSSLSSTTWTSYSVLQTVFPCWSMASCSSRGRRTKSRAIRASKPSISARRLMPELLSLDRLKAGYGEAVVLAEISLRLDRGRSLALLGRNGMGKTTLINSIVGVTRYRGGAIRLDGRDITQLPPERRARHHPAAPRGPRASRVRRVPEEPQYFPLLNGEQKLNAVGIPGLWTPQK